MGKKRISNYDPIFKDQGINHVAAAGKHGFGVQGITWPMVGGGVFTFAGVGLVDMGDALYQVTINNNTSAARPSTVTLKTTAGFTVTGATAADILDIQITGRLKGQPA